MKLWMSLYAMIWIVFLEFLFVMTPGGSSALVYVHVAVGVAILGLAFYNFDGVRKTRVPGRVKRTAQSTLSLSGVMVVLGVLLFFDVGKEWVIPLIGVSIYGIILLFRVVNAFAIITQAAAVAIAYDMWEDREFVKETEPGEVPVNPAAQKAASEAVSSAPRSI